MEVFYRVEKFRPDTLADVSGHEDILNTSKCLHISHNELS